MPFSPSLCITLHKVMDEYRHCRHRSIKFQMLTGVMKSASWQEQVFLLYHFSLSLQSSILSIIRNKKKRTRENCCTLSELIHPSYKFLWIFMAMFLWPTIRINTEILEPWIFYITLLVVSIHFIYFIYLIHAYLI